MSTKYYALKAFSYPVFHLGNSPFAVRLRHIHRAIIYYGKVAAIVLPALGLLYALAGFYVPAHINFSSRAPSCTLSPMLLPKLMSFTPSADYAVTAPASASLIGYPLLSLRICAIPTAISSSGSSSTIKVQQLKVPLSKRIVVTNRSQLSATPRISGDQVSTKNNIIFQLSEPDHYFDYALKVGDATTSCLAQDTYVACPTAQLRLRQGEPYTFELLQKLGTSERPLYARELTTITSVAMSSSTINDSQVIYDSPLSAILTFSKPLAKSGNIRLVQLSSPELTIPATTAVDGNTLTLHWDTALPRLQNFLLTIDSTMATDGGYLETPMNIHFSTSGGPKVVSSSLPSYKAPSNADFTLTFDQPLSADQSIQNSIAVTVDSHAQPYVSSVEGSKLHIRLKAALEPCTAFSVAIGDTLLSSYGFSGGSGYTSTSRTQCQRQFSIGSSVEGRSINAYAFGTGPSTYVYMSNLHGDEKSGYYILSDWVDYLESHPADVPTKATIIVIPHLNPDGYAHSSRYNAHGVDLNRNFPSASWKSDVVILGGSTLVGGGGPTPLSEPESLAIKNYLAAVSPRLVMSYHSQGSIVIANGSGDSNSIASMYASAVDYRHIPTETSTDAFEYDTTGALEDWLYEVPGIPTVLVELSSHNNAGLFTYHKDPMLKLLQ